MAQTDSLFAFDDNSWQHAVNVGRIAEIRRRDTDAEWEVALKAPVNRVLPVARAHLKRLWAAFGEG